MRNRDFVVRELRSVPTPTQTGGCERCLKVETSERPNVPKIETRKAALPLGRWPGLDFARFWAGFAGGQAEMPVPLHPTPVFFRKSGF